MGDIVYLLHLLADNKVLTLPEERENWSLWNCIWTVSLWFIKILVPFTTIVQWFLKLLLAVSACVCAYSHLVWGFFPQQNAMSVHDLNRCGCFNDLKGNAYYCTHTCSLQIPFQNTCHLHGPERYSFPTFQLDSLIPTSNYQLVKLVSFLLRCKWYWKYRESIISHDLPYCWC